MQDAPNSVTAFVLAGGKSTRMGSDKAFVVLDGQTLLGRALHAVRTVTHNVMVVGQRSKFSTHAPVVEDIFADRGPLGGIHAALSVSATELNLILAVDLPFVEEGFLSFLLKAAEETDAMAVVPRAAGGWQPLCAVYRKVFGKAVEAALKAGRNKIDLLFGPVPVLTISEQEIRSAGFSLDMFRNINTREELEQAGRA
jgi:molybdopterin-guanine dinucleotide biosynthesis protein A